MKKYPLNGCIWCERHYEVDKELGARKSKHYCEKLRTNNDYTPIEFEEMAELRENGDLESFEKFPTWCPLEEY